MYLSKRNPFFQVSGGCQQEESHHSHDRERRTNSKHKQEPQRKLRTKREHKRRRQRESKHLLKSEQRNKFIIEPRKDKKTTKTSHTASPGIDSPQEQEITLTVR